MRVEPWDEANQALVGLVHPPDWQNPTPKDRYDLVVLGAGSAGLISAAGAAGLGARVALVERHLMGGDCLNVGCVPSKALIRAARAAADARSAGGLGVRIPGDVHVDFPAVMVRMRGLRSRIAPVDSAQRYREMGIDVFLGDGVFSGPDSLRVGEATLRFVKAVIATGGRPVAPEIPGLKDAGYLTNENLFELTELPRRLAVVGAGPIGCEMAQAFARFGSQVTIIHRGERLMSREDADGVALVQQSFANDGIQFRFRATLHRVDREGGSRQLTIATPAGEEALEVDQLLVGLGRRPNVESLGLEQAGVKVREEAIDVDDALRTSNRRIFAAGDVCLKHQFTHMADASARIVIQNALFGIPTMKKVSDLVVPWCTYTDPEIAHVGLDPETARQRGIPIQTFEQRFDHVDRAILDGETDGSVKVYVREGTDRIVGATIVGRHAGDMISEITVAMQGGMGLGALASAIHPYPTQAEAIKRVADAYNRTRLTPLAKSWIQRWLAWRR